jgi:hypothetical protein
MWGYFSLAESLFFTSGIALWYLALFVEFRANYNYQDVDTLSVLSQVALWTSLQVIPAIFAFGRRKAPFVLFTVLSLNPVYWLINLAYINSRPTRFHSKTPKADATLDFIEATSSVDSKTRSSGARLNAFGKAVAQDLEASVPAQESSAQKTWDSKLTLGQLSLLVPFFHISTIGLLVIVTALSSRNISGDLESRLVVANLPFVGICVLCQLFTTFILVGAVDRAAVRKSKISGSPTSSST